MGWEPHISELVSDPWVPSSRNPPVVAEVTAVCVDRFVASDQAGHGLRSKATPESRASNAARNGRRMIERLGLRWKVPISHMTFQFEGEDVVIPYVSPLHLFPYILENHRELLLGGFKDLPLGVDLLKGWWQNFKVSHPQHVVYSAHEESELGYTIPLYLYGDEGRGKRRGNTAVFTAEVPFGLHTVKNERSDHRNIHCCKCCPQEHTGKRFPFMEPHWTGTIGYATHNMKEHSFLSKFLLWVMPCQLYKTHDKLMSLVVERLAGEFRRLFYEGVHVHGRVWTFAIVGMKGDMKWHADLGNLLRHHGTRGKRRPLMMCPECHAGSAGMPYEDISESPAWMGSLYQTRPWEARHPLADCPFDPICPEKIHKRDVFHTTRLGVFRHYVGSVLVTVIKWGYFKMGPPPEEGNSADVQLQRSFGHCKLWCATFSKSLALRSFSRRLFNFPNYHTYPWANTKGSDTFILCQWLVDLLGQLLSQPLHDQAHGPMFEVMREVGKAAINFSKMLFPHHLFLARSCAMFAVEQGAVFWKGYNWLAYQSLHRFDICCWAVVPKNHSFRHTLLDIELALQSGADVILNPAGTSCEMNEDVIGKVCRLYRRVESRYNMARVLELYLIKVRLLHLNVEKRLGL